MKNLFSNDGKRDGLFFSLLSGLLFSFVLFAYGASTPNTLGHFDIRDYGAVPNSTGAAAANSTAINNAITDANAIPAGGTSRGVVFYPPGDWYVSAALIPLDNVSHKGSGIESTRIIGTVAGTPVFSRTVAGNIAGVHFSDMTISRNVTAIAGGYGIELTASGATCGGVCNTGLSDIKNVLVEKAYDGIRWGPNNGGRWVSVTVQNSEHYGIFSKGSNGQYIDVSVISSKNNGWITSPTAGETIDGGSFSNCTIFASGQNPLGGSVYDTAVDSFVWNIPATDVAGFLMHGFTLDTTGRDAIRATNASNIILSGVVITGGNTTGNVGINVIRTNNALTQLVVNGGVIQGSYSTGIQTNARVGGSITVPILLSAVGAFTSIHIDNPSDGSGTTNLTIGSSFLSKAGAGNVILIEKTGANIGSRTGVTGDGGITIVGNGANLATSDWVNIAATYTGEYRISSNNQTGDRYRDSAGGTDVRVWDVNAAAITAAATCTQDQKIKINVWGVGVKGMNVCSIP